MSHSRPAPRRRRGFSLVEVCLALGIVTFALVALVGLLATGLRTNQESAEDVQAANLAAAAIAQRRAAPTASDPTLLLPPLNGAVQSPILITPATQPYRGTVYLTGDGAVAVGTTDRYYRMDYRLSRDASGRLAQVHLSYVTPWQAEPRELPTATPGGAFAKTRYELTTYLPVPVP